MLCCFDLVEQTLLCSVETQVVSGGWTTSRRFLEGTNGEGELEEASDGIICAVLLDLTPQ